MPTTTPVRRRTPLAISLSVLAGLVCGALLVTAVGVAAGTGALAGESDQVKAMRVLRADQAALGRFIGQAQDDRRLDDLHQSAQSAAQLAAQVRSRDTSLAVLDDRRVQADAMHAHQATAAALAAFSELDRVTPKSLDGWDAGERQAVSAVGELDAAAAPVAAMDPKRPLRLDSSRVESLVERTSTYLTTSARRLARYEKRMAKFRRLNRGKIQAAADYQATVQAQIGAYHQTRKDLQSYLDDTKEFDDRVEAFRTALSDAKSRREGIRSTLASMTPPGALQGEHAQLINVLDHAIAATDVGVDLADATQRLRDDGDYDTSGFDLPEYDDFVKQSEQITKERDAAVASWTSAMNTYMGRLRHPKGAPTRPQI